MNVQQKQISIDEAQPAGNSFIEECSLAELHERIRVELLAHLALIGLDPLVPAPDQTYTKDLVRSRHAAQRAEFREGEQQFLFRHGRKLLPHFAEGREVIPEAVDPAISLVISETEDADLFRLATLLWSVPVSRGYGRRLRFLVRDRANGKLIGIFALTDPVFNLQARDSWIGWDVDDRRQRLVHVMDAHVVGAVPPYSSLLGGKITAALMTSQEVCDAFAAKYSHRSGIISQQYKHAQLVLITVTSALGRSSLYNRLKLPGVLEFLHIGQTTGWGHFHIPQPLFFLMRELLRREGHAYASGRARPPSPQARHQQGSIRSPACTELARVPMWDGRDWRSIASFYGNYWYTRRQSLAHSACADPVRLPAVDKGEHLGAINRANSQVIDYLKRSSGQRKRGITYAADTKRSF